jgi:glycogen debranching enzyme
VNLAVEMRARADRRVIYSGRSVLVTGVYGSVSTSGEGFYFDNTRLLSRLEFSVGGVPASAFAFSPVGHNASLAYLEVPQGQRDHEEEVYKQVSGAHLQVSAFVDEGLRLRIEAHNYEHRELDVPLELHLAADFVAPQMAEQGKRKVDGELTESWDPQGQLEFRFRTDELDRAVRIRIEHGPPASWRDGVLLLPLRLDARGQATVELAVLPEFDGKRHPGPSASFAAPTELRRLSSELHDHVPELSSSNDTVSRAWRTAVADFASLPLGLPEAPATPIAGLPLYGRFFARDAMTAGWQGLLAMPRPLRDSLAASAALQGRVIDDWRDEEPGALIHTADNAPPAAQGKNPHERYYGDYASPVDFLAMLGQYVAWTDDKQTARELLPAARRVLQWIDRYGVGTDGFLSYETRSKKGVKNQGWKDSENAIVDERGEIVPDPIVATELQGYWYAGLRNAALVFLVAGDRAAALHLLRRAKKLRQQVNEKLWWPEEQTYLLGLGPDGEPLRSVASNAGHLLATAVADEHKGRLTARRLMREDMFSGWGIRTLSSQHPAYNPFSYHLGSVWPVEQSTIAAGFMRYGCITELHQLARGFFDLTELFIANRLPESVGGIARDAERPHPGIYPKANEPQAWSATTVVFMVQALLGIRPLAPARTLAVDPHLPDWLPDLQLRGVQVGDARVDLRAWRTRSGKTRWKAEVRRGYLHVIHQPPERGATLPRRFQAALGG